MSASPNEEGWNAFVAVNLNCLRAAAGLALAWVFWRMSHHPDWELFLFLAAVFGLAGVKRAIHALIGLIRMILRARRWATFRRQGVDPKADTLGSDEALRARGLLK